MRNKAEAINEVWCWDFIHDRDENGRVLRWLMIEDEFTREGLAVEVRRSFKAEDVLDVLSELMMIRGVPRHIRSDHGPEFIAKVGHNPGRVTASHTRSNIKNLLGQMAGEDSHNTWSKVWGAGQRADHSPRIAPTFACGSSLRARSAAARAASFRPSRW